MTMHTCPCSTLGPGPHDIEATHVNPKACEHAEYPVAAQTLTPGEEVRTLDEVRDWLDSIHESAADNESAHGSEDNLYAAVLTAIANGTAEHPQAMAALALTSRDISFERWYA